MQNNSLFDEWSVEYGLTDASRQNTDQSSTHPLHACVINGASTFIHSPTLQEKDPSYFERLKNFARERGIRLQACKRKSNEPHKHDSRRRRFAPLLLLTLGISSAPLLHAQSQTQNLGLSSENVIEHTHDHNHEMKAHDVFDGDINAQAHQQIKNILTKKLKITKETPENIKEDIDRMAGYYSKFDKVVELIASLENADWTLQYSPHTFQTSVHGSNLSVDSLTVYFDPRSGAKLQFYTRCSDAKPFCIASPADALLHELIHVQSITHDTDRFIAQGGMSQTIYPHKHEYETIEKENALYKSMSKLDKNPRPLRHDHSGRHVLVSCVTCLD